MNNRAIWAGVAGGALVSLAFVASEVRKLQQPAFAASAETRVSMAAERAVMDHLGRVYGLDAARLASLRVFTQSLGIR